MSLLVTPEVHFMSHTGLHKLTNISYANVVICPPPESLLYSSSQSYLYQIIPVLILVKQNANKNSIGLSGLPNMGRNMDQINPIR